MMARANSGSPLYWYGEPGMKSGISSPTHTPLWIAWVVTYHMKVHTQCVECTTITSGFSARIASPISRSPAISGRTKSGAFSSIPMRGECAATAARMMPPAMVSSVDSCDPTVARLVQHRHAVDLDVDALPVRRAADAGARGLLAVQH